MFSGAKSFDTLAVCEGAHPSLNLHLNFAFCKAKERLCCDQEVKVNSRQEFFYLG